ncbi:phosphate/phosphite/phosphonate ABC transporter substrate-binding protein [Microbacterium sp.]|uniref:phosphate/phosphite/phosphonate ABC transporter substrate-binding protein n=1 Tax=Microbacterium sp. TaxID=51671 RepID=UPI003C72E80F
MRFTRPATAAALAAIVLVTAGCSGSSEPEATGDGDPTELTLVLTPSVEADVLATSGDELATMLTDELGIDVTYYGVEDYTAAVTAFETGQAQIGMLAPALVVNAIDRADAVPILTVERYGSSTYVTQWFTNDPARFCLDEVVTDDEGYTFCNGTDVSPHVGPVGEDALELVAPDDTISFVDPTSTSGYYFPVLQLIDLGVIESPDDLTGAFFAQGHPESVNAVANGEATIGVSFDDARTNVVEENPTVGQDVTVFAWSTNIPNDGVAVAGDLSEDLQQRIKDAFLAIASTDDGLTLLDELYTVDGFSDPDLDAIDSLRKVLAAFPE